MIANHIFSHLDYMTCHNFVAGCVHKAVGTVSGRVARTVAAPVSSQVQFLLIAECTMHLTHVLIILLSDNLSTTEHGVKFIQSSGDVMKRKTNDLHRVSSPSGSGCKQ